MEIILLNKGATDSLLLDALYLINKEVLATDIEGILNGTNHLFNRPKIRSGAIIPNSNYKLLKGSALLMNYDNPIRLVTSDFTTSLDENRIFIDDSSICIRD